MRLVKGLKLLKQQATLESLANSDDLEFAELCQFRQISRLEIEDTITGIEPFPGEMMSPKRINVALPDDIYDILVEWVEIFLELIFEVPTADYLLFLVNNVISSKHVKYLEY